MAKPILYLVKDDKKYRILKYDKLTGEVKLRGELRDFKSNIHRAVEAGYQIVREQILEPR